MASYAMYNLSLKKCATCNYWQSPDRSFEFAGKKPVRLKASGEKAACSAYPSRTISANNTCPRWMKWINIP